MIPEFQAPSGVAMGGDLHRGRAGGGLRYTRLPQCERGETGG